MKIAVEDNYASYYQITRKLRASSCSAKYMLGSSKPSALTVKAILSCVNGTHKFIIILTTYSPVAEKENYSLMLDFLK